MYISAKIAALRRQNKTWNTSHYMRSIQINYLVSKHRMGAVILTNDIKLQLEAIKRTHGEVE